MGEIEETILVVTAKGIVLRILTEDLIERRRGGRGVNVISLDIGDSVVGTVIDYREENVFVTTKMGQIINFNVDDVRITNRGCRGVKAIHLIDGDVVVSIV